MYALMQFQRSRSSEKCDMALASETKYVVLFLKSRLHRPCFVEAS